MRSLAAHSLAEVIKWSELALVRFRSATRSPRDFERVELGKLQTNFQQLIPEHASARLGRLVQKVVVTRF